MEEAITAVKRKAGRPLVKPGQRMEKHTVMMSGAMHEWAMNHPEGLSGLVRRLLEEERAKSLRGGARKGHDENRRERHEDRHLEDHGG